MFLHQETAVTGHERTNDRAGVAPSRGAGHLGEAGGKVRGSVRPLAFAPRYSISNLRLSVFLFCENSWRNSMLTVFERIPDLFVQHYDTSFQVWAREFRTRGQECAIPFDRKPGVPALLDSEGRAIWKGAWLVAEVDRSQPQMPRVVIRPKDDEAAAAIERHTREMAPHWLS